HPVACFTCRCLCNVQRTSVFPEFLAVIGVVRNGAPGKQGYTDAGHNKRGDRWRNSFEATLSNAEFSISSLVLPFSVNKGATTYFAIGFKPTASGAVTGTLTLTSSNGAVLLTVSLSGTGASSGSSSSTSTPYLTSTPSSVSYGSVAVGNKLTQTLAIKNVTSSNVSVSSFSISNPAFSISSLTVPFSIGAGGTSYSAVGFKPTAAGGFTGSLTLKNSSGAALVTVPLSGTGSTAASSLVSSTSSLSFGSETVGVSTTLPVTLTNNGTSN